MNHFLYTLSRKFKHSIIHPQWISNIQHLKRLKSLSTINSSLILDIGSGDSDIENYLGDNNKLVKIDYPNTNIKYQNKPTIFATASILPIKSSSIDKIFLFEVIEHLEDVNAAFKEAHRVLKPSGTIYISVPFTYPLHDLPYDFRRYTPKGLENILTRNGFSIQSIKKYPSNWASILYLLNIQYLNFLKKTNSISVVLSYLILPLIYTLCLTNNCLASLKLNASDSEILFLGTYTKAIKTL